MPIITRLYTPADTQPIMDLFHDTVHAINIRDYTLEQVEAWAPHVMDYHRWEQSLRGRHTYVAVTVGTIVGFGDYEDNGHLDRFYVHTDFQGIGVGQALLARVEDAAKAQGITRFFTDASITAKPFFVKRGFAVVREQQVLRRGVMFTNYRMEKVL